jgi:cytochrome c oxidase subunit 2
MDLSAKKSRPGGGTLIWVVVSGVAIIVGGFLMSLLTPSVFPVQASAEAEQIDNLFRLFLFLGGVVFFLVQGLLVYSVIRFRVRKGDTSDGASFNGNTTLEIIWTAIPAVVVVFITIYSYSVWVSIREPKSDELAITAVGQRFVWAFTYEDPLDRLVDAPTQTFNDAVLHTYVGRPIRLAMSTRDVNHAFWVPTMRIKQDLLAGRTTEITFTPSKAGYYRIVCAELCGGGHGGMYSYIQVYETEQEWMERFIDVRVDRILNPPSDPVEIGFNLLESGAYPCAGCHILDSLGWGGVTGPVLNGIADTAVRRAGSAGVAGPADYIASSIRHPNDYLVPGYRNGLMPQFGPTEDEPETVDGAYYQYMSDDDLFAIVSYLCTQSSTGESTCGDEATVTEAVAAQR